jgi:hypothetical protein
LSAGLAAGGGHLSSLNAFAILWKAMVPRRTPIPKPDGAVDPRLEAAAAAALERQRGRAVWTGGPPQAGALAAAIIRKKTPPKGGKSVAELKRQWRDIVGEKLAPMTDPEKISRGPAGRTLVVKVAGPAAPFVQHQRALILERCNLAGADIRDITLVQGVITRRTAPNVRPISAPLSADEEMILARSLDAIGSPSLKAALLRLGRAVGQKRDTSL